MDASVLKGALSAVRTDAGGPPASEDADGAAGAGNARRCYLEPAAGAEALLVVFSGHFPEAVELGYDVPFEFKRFLGRHPLRVHTLFLRDASMSWYLAGVDGLGDSVQEVADFIAHEREQLGAARLFTLGSSMGGYAALLFGHLLNADVALAFGPQVYLDQATRRELKVPGYRYESCLMKVEQMARSKGIDKYLKLTNLLPLSIGKAHIHLGQNETGDINQARGFNDQPNIKFVVWPGGNHMVVKALRDEGKLLQILQRNFAPEGEAGADPEGLRAEGNELVKAGKYAEAAEAYTKALQAGGGPSHHLVLANRSLCLLKLGRPEDAWYDADAAVRMEPTYAKGFYRRALCEAERGFLASALKSVEEARALDPADKALRTLGADLQRKAAAKPGGPPPEAVFPSYCA